MFPGCSLDAEMKCELTVNYSDLLWLYVPWMFLGCRYQMSVKGYLQWSLREVLTSCFFTRNMLYMSFRKLFYEQFISADYLIYRVWNFESVAVQEILFFEENFPIRGRRETFVGADCRILYRPVRLRRLLIYYIILINYCCSRNQEQPQRLWHEIFNVLCICISAINTLFEVVIKENLF